MGKIYKVIEPRSFQNPENETAPDEMILKWINSQGGLEYYHFDCDLEFEYRANRFNTLNQNEEPSNTILQTSVKIKLFENGLTQQNFIGIIFLVASPIIYRLDRNRNEEEREIAIRTKTIENIPLNRRHQIELEIVQKEPDIIFK